VFPESKIIYIIRDIHGQVASMKQHFINESKKGSVHKLPKLENACWSVDKSANEDADRIYPGNFNLLPEAWLRLNECALKSLQKLKFKNCLVLSYEQMVQHQEKTFGDIFEFLQLSKKYKSHEEKISAQKIAYKNTTTSGNPLIKWKNQLSEEEQRLVRTYVSENKSRIEYMMGVFNFE
jgi:hypothetical protein